MFLIALAIATVTPPDRWVRIGGINDRYDEFVDMESVRRSGDKVVIWTRRKFVRDKVTSWNELEIDCSMRTETVLAYIRDDAGTITHNAVRPHRGASPVLPDTAEEKIFNIACR